LSAGIGEDRWLELAGFLMLRGLASRRGRPLSPGELLAAICGPIFDPGAKIVDVCVRGQAPARFDSINTVWIRDISSPAERCPSLGR